MKGIRDVTVLLMAPGGAWHRRVAATALGDGYGAVVKPPRPGFYYVHVKSPSVGLRSTNTNYLVVQAVDPKPTRAAQTNGPGGSPQ